MSRRLTLLLAAAAALLLAGGAAFATSTTRSGTAVAGIVALTQDAPRAYSSASWKTVGQVEVYAAEGQWVDARFTAESACYGKAGAWCRLCSGVLNRSQVTTGQPRLPQNA